MVCEMRNAQQGVVLVLASLEKHYSLDESSLHSLEKHYSLDESYGNGGGSGYGGGRVGRAAGGKGSNPPQEITSKHQGYLRAPTCHTTAILWLQSRCVGNTISIVPAEHDQPLVTAR